MKKSDLRYGNVVELKNGYKYFTNGNKLLNLKANLSINLDYYNENLLHISNGGLLDVMKVYKDYTLTELLWERKETPKLTEDEKAILKNLPKEYKWIARDESGWIFLYKNEPLKISISWSGSMYTTLPFEHLFQFIKWEDDEPYSIEDLLKGEENEKED